MAKRLITLRIDEETLAQFDAWCATHKRSRTEVVATFMERQVRAEPATKAR